MPTERRQRGVTLVELVLAVVILSVAVTGIAAAYVTMIAKSADPLIDVQASAIAEAYLDEILAKPLTGPAPASGARADKTTVGDYDGLVDTPPEDQFGNALPGLSDYTVSVSTGGGGLGIGATSVTVTVTHGSGRSVVLRGYKSGAL